MPSRTRTERERMQADEIYEAGSSMRVRTVVNIHGSFLKLSVRFRLPERHLQNQISTRIQIMLVLVHTVDQITRMVGDVHNRSWTFRSTPNRLGISTTVRLRDTHIAETGMKFSCFILQGCLWHRVSEMLLALGAPVTTKCDFCQVSFCGINVQGRCFAAAIPSQHPHNMSDVGDLIQSSEVYECFENNTVEVDIMLDYLTNRQITPRQIYRDVSS